MNIEKLFEAYYECRKNKRNTKSAIEFEMNYERELFCLYDEVVSRSYTISPAIAFIVNHPVKREIFAGNFRDRVIHHYLIRELNPFFEKLFIHDSYACRPGRGTLFGIRRAEKFVRSCSQGYTRDAFVLQLDIAGFFMSIDRKKLLIRLSTFVQDQFDAKNEDSSELIYLITKILSHNPINDCIIRGTRQDWVGLPKNKSLFFSLPGKGLPIGNLTSQVFANFYMHILDIFIKKELSIKYYGRYVDDLLLIHNNREYLLSIISQIRYFALDTLGLILHPKKIRFHHIRDGFPFLGAYIKPYRTYIGNRTKENFYRKISTVSSLEQPKMIESSINSYLGILGHFSTFSLRKKCMGQFSDDFWQSFSLGEKYRKITHNRKDNVYFSKN